MCISNATTCTAWEPYAATKAWTLAAGGSGVRTISAGFRDAYGNATATPARATVTYDVTAPTGGTLGATGSSGRASLYWSGFSEPLSGVASYRIVRAAGAPPASCAAGTAVWQGTGTSWADTGLTDGATYGYRVCATDGAGNESAGATATVRPAPEYAPPLGTLSVTSPALTASTTITLGLSAADGSGVAAMCLSNATTCAAWEPYAATRTWTLAAGGSGVRTISVWFRDVWGNATATPVKATVTYDATGPAGGTLTATAAAGRVTLAWSGVTDALSGVASYRLVAQAGAAPTSCAAGIVLFQGAGTAPVVHAGLASRSTWGYRLCATDGLGNANAGVTKTVTVP
jgi:hypothetical protein